MPEANLGRHFFLLKHGPSVKAIIDKDHKYERYTSPLSSSSPHSSSSSSLLPTLHSGFILNTHSDLYHKHKVFILNTRIHNTHRPQQRNHSCGHHLMTISRLLCDNSKMEQLKEVASKMAIHSQLFEDETIEREGNYYVPMEALIDLYESGVPVQYFDNFYNNE